ncbi:MAG: hypothetical protein JXA14_21850 [Anaerolineae bacterium]|nr:hypothetical protein [Anaerolineae bacterium]
MRPSSASKFRLPQRLVFLLAAVAALLPLVTARADVGPKPTADFEFEYQIDPVDIVEGKLIQCEDETCETGNPLEELGPQHFECALASCSSIAYGYATYMKLVITFTDRTRESNVFTKQARDAAYRVIVLESSLQVEEVRKGIVSGGCCSALAATIALELLVATIYVNVFHLSRTILGWVPLSSILTVPIVWFVFPLLPLPAGWVVGLSEAFAVVFETSFIYLVTRRTTSLRHVAALSLLMNGTSFLIGLLLRL